MKKIFSIKPILVHVHIFYNNMWPELKKCLKNIEPYEFKLFITMVNDNKDLIRDIKKDFPDAFVKIVPNRGFDVGPFVDVLNEVDLNDYSFVVKLHTKRDVQKKCELNNGYDVSGKKWREYSLSFIKNKKNFQKCVKAFVKDKKLAMTGNYHLILNSEQDAQLPTVKLKEFLIKNHLLEEKFQFIAGTMFMCRANVLQNIKNLHLSLSDFEISDPKLQPQLAHVMERIFGYVSAKEGYYIKDVCHSVLIKNYKSFGVKNSRYFKIFRYNLYKVLKILHIVSKKKFNKKFPKGYSILVHSKLFDSKWYLMQYSDVRIAQKDPIRHYIEAGWKENRNPSKIFDGNKYLMENPDVREILVCPLLHWLKYGKFEGRSFPSSLLNSKNNSIRKFELCNCLKIKNKIVIICKTANTDEKLYIKLHNSLKKESKTPAFLKKISLGFLRYHTTMHYFILPIETFHQENDISFFTQNMEQLAIPQKNIFNFADLRNTGFYARMSDNRILIENKKHFIYHVLISKEYTFGDKKLFLKILLNKPQNVLFSEQMDLKADNSFSLFKYFYKNHKNSFYITSAKAYDNETDTNLKKQMIVKNSKKHYKKFIDAKLLVTSWNINNVIPTNIKDIHLSIMQTKWMLIPHGITAGDKNSVEISRFNFGNSDAIFCCSGYEKKELETLGYENIIVSGYPRMDKWDNPKTDEKKMILFFTWRRELYFHNLEYFKQSKYYQYIKDFVQKITLGCPNLTIYYFIHNSIKNDAIEFLKTDLSVINPNIVFVRNDDAENFNYLFNECKYLITDYSSAAFDFAYKKNNVAIYYIADEFLKGHYQLTKQFFKIVQGGVFEKDTDIVRFLQNPKPINKNKFFKYRDNNNSRRITKYIDSVLSN